MADGLAAAAVVYFSGVTLSIYSEPALDRFAEALDRARAQLFSARVQALQESGFHLGKRPLERGVVGAATQAEQEEKGDGPLRRHGVDVLWFVRRRGNFSMGRGAQGWSRGTRISPRAAPTQ